MAAIVYEAMLAPSDSACVREFVVGVCAACVYVCLCVCAVTRVQMCAWCKPYKSMTEHNEILHYGNKLPQNATRTNYNLYMLK